MTPSQRQDQIKKLEKEIQQTIDREFAADKDLAAKRDAKEAADKAWNDAWQHRNRLVQEQLKAIRSDLATLRGDARKAREGLDPDVVFPDPVEWKWYASLFRGTTYHSLKKLWAISKDRKFILVKVPGHSYWSGRQSNYGTTEWYVFPFMADNDGGFQRAGHTWNFQGRMTKTEKNQLATMGFDLGDPGQATPS